MFKIVDANAMKYIEWTYVGLNKTHCVNAIVK